ncbi:MAG: fibro-slime domain-containing protein [Ruminococcus bromii]|nr:fibro-slime domain-containing protein [Ruminococcus bromii]
MKTSIKRFSKCSISVVLAVMMLVTSLTVGMVNFNAVTLSDSDSSAVSAASENDAVGANSDGSEAVGANAGNSVGAVAQFTEGEKIYLDLSAFTSWKEPNATFKAQFYYYDTGSAVNGMSDAVKVDDNTYYVTVPNAYCGYVEFKRYSADGGQLWNTSAKLSNKGTNNAYKVKDWNNSAEWSVYSGDPPTPAKKIYDAVASDAIKNNSNLYTINTTFYDYYTDNEVNNGWRKYSQIDSNKGTSYESHGKNSAGQADPYTKLNTALANYAKTNGVKRPLYFGVFYNVNDNTSTDPFGATLYNFSNWVNNSSRLGSYYNSVVGLSGRTLTSDKKIRYYNNDGTNAADHETDDGATMPLFDADWLTTNNFATIVNSEFPMRKTTQNNVPYYGFDSAAKDTIWFSGYGSDTLTTNYGNQDTDCVYDAVSNFGGGSNGVGFFPFDASITNGGTTKNNANDYGFGMRTDIEFNVGKDGKINGVDQVFNFTGDDDLWVYIDGKLVLDLGGAHKKAEGSIDFSTKTVTVRTGTKSVNNVTRNTSFEFDNQDPSKTHTLTMFYMERGMIESNLKFGFNFSPVGNQFTTENHVDTANVNEGLKSAVAAADTFTYTHKTNGSASANKTYTHSKDGSKSTNSNGQYVVNDSERAAFADQFTVGNSFNVNESYTSNLQYDTTYKVTDQKTGALISSGTGTGTGDFDFKTTDTAKFAKTDILLSYTNTPKVGDVDVKKIVQNEAGTEITSDTTEFDATVEVSLNGTDYARYPLQYTVDNDSTVYTLTSGGKLADGAKLKAGRTLHFEGLPIGAKVKVTEDTVAKYDTTVQVTGGTSQATSSADVAVADTNQTITFTNKKQATTPVKVQHLLHSNSPENSTDKLYTTIKVYKNGVLQDTICTDKDTSTTPATVPAQYIVKNEGYTFTVTLTTKPKASYKFNDFYDNDETKTLGNGDFKNFTSYTKDTNNESSTTITVKVDDLFNGDAVDTKYLVLRFYSLLSTDVKYKIDYLFTTRLYNDRVYTVSGKLTDDEINTYFGGVVPTELNDAFVQSKIPYESNFMKNLHWFDVAQNKSTLTGNVLYAKLYSYQTNKTVSARIYNNTDTPVTVSGVSYGDPFTVNDAETEYQKNGGHYLQVKIPEGKFFSYWAIYKASTFGTDDQIEVARCYSEYFNYTGYDDYVVKAIFTTDPKQKNTELYVSENENLCTAVYLQTTRNHWNNTTTGSDVSGKYGSADTEYDRIYLDFALAYNYKGLLLRTYDGNDIKIGVKIYAVKDGDARLLKDAKFELTNLDNKNRLEYYYGIDNTRPNFKEYTYYAVPYLTVNGSAPAQMKITNSGTVSIKDIANKPLSGDNKHTYPTIDNVVYD